MDKGDKFIGDTLILMYDGTSKKIKDIKIGDELISPNGKRLIVEKINKKEKEMYFIYPVKGSPYSIPEDHKLVLKISYSPFVQWVKNDNSYRVIWIENFSLKSKLFSIGVYETKKKAFKEAKKYLKKHVLNNKKYRQYGDIITISVNEFLKLPKYKQNWFKGFSVGIDFEENNIELDPYILGYWLGDGHSYGSRITTAESEVLDYFNDFAKKNGLFVKKAVNSNYDYNITSGKDFTGINPLLTFLKNNNLIKNKHIPDKYKFNSRKNRLKLLAGIVDSDGHYGNGYYDFIFKSEKLADDIIFLARSLGFHCSKSICQKTCTNSSRGRVTGTYYRFSVCGEGLEEIPSLLNRKKAKERAQKKSASVTGFTIFNLGKELCYEIKTNSNRLLLDDFTVIHK